MGGVRSCPRRSQVYAATKLWGERRQEGRVAHGDGEGMEDNAMGGPWGENNFSRPTLSSKLGENNFKQV